MLEREKGVETPKQRNPQKHRPAERGVQNGVQNEAQRQALAGGLARRNRKAQTEGIRLEGSGDIVPARNAAGRSGKKSAGPQGTTAREICELWARTHNYHGKRAAEALRKTTGEIEARQTTQAHIDEAIEILKKQYATATVYSSAGHLRGILEILRDNGAPKLTVHTRKPRPRSTSPTEEELAAIYAAAQPWEKCWIILQAELGLRTDEARQVNDATHDAGNGTITIIGKGKKPRTLPTTDRLEQFFAIAPKALTTTPLMDRFRGRHVNQHVQDRAWKRLLKDAGIARHLRPHDLRRRAATQTYARTKDLRAAQQLLGHDNLASTLTYLAHHEPASLKPLIEALRIPTEAKQ